MWSNLAKELGAPDINATLEKIGNAVAPREDDDDEYYDDDGYDDDEYYDDDEDYDDEQDYDDGNEVDVGKMMKSVANASPFRLAGMLAKSLDARPVETGNEGDSKKNYELEGVNRQNEYNTQETSQNFERALFPQASLPKLDEAVRPGDKTDAGNYSLTEGREKIFKQVDPIDQLPNQSLGVGEAHTIGKSDFVETAPLENSNLPKDKASPSRLECDEPTPHPSNVAAQIAVNIPEQIAAQSQKARRDKNEPFFLSEKTATETKLLSTKKSNVVDTKTIGDAAKANSSVMEKTPTFTNPKEKQHKQKKNFEHPIAPINGLNGQEESHLRKTKEATIQSVQKATPKQRDTRKVRKERLQPKENNNSIEMEAKALESVVSMDDDNKNIIKNDVANGTGFIKNETTIKPTNVIEEVVPSTSSQDHKISCDGVERLEAKVTTSKSSKDIEYVLPSTSPQNHSISRAVVQDASGLQTNKGGPKRSSQREDYKQKLSKAELDQKELQIQLENARKEIKTLQYQATVDKEKAESEKEDLLLQFQKKETRLLQATSEDNHNQTLLLRQECAAKTQHLEQLLAKEQRESQDEKEEYKRLLQESYANFDRVENQLKANAKKYEIDIAQAKKQEERALRKVDDRMAQTMAVLDERDEEISRLKKALKDMESKVSEHKEGEEEAEDELEELHHENDALQKTVETLELETDRLREQVASLRTGSEELSGLQMELTMLKEERARERSKSQAAADSALEFRTQIDSERLNALSELKDSKQKLAAALGDLEIARSDNARMMMANDNLQSALEAFQDERQAEMEMIEEQQRESEEAIKSAHATSTNALKQIHQTEMDAIQRASDDAVRNVMNEMELVEGTIETLKSENNQMRRSLDEAIKRLQTTQEDVIDRNVMKNILVDWCTLNDKSKRNQVLEVMANLLHFSEEEKEKVHITSNNLDTIRAKVVGALAVPLPPPKADVEHLEGSNVQEKWINFLMAETDS